METFVVISTLFVIGSLTGYVIELFYRRFFSQKRWVNPGFMVGPYIPLYGFGVILLYSVSNFGIADTSLPEWVKTLIILGIIGVLMTLIELIAGLIFIRGMHIKLWDYSNRWGNFKGIICPLFSIIWFVAGSLYYFFLNPLIIKAVVAIAENPIYDYFIGLVIGMMLVDLAYSLHLGLKVKKFSDDMVIKFEEFKVSVRDAEKNSEDRSIVRKAPTYEKMKHYLEVYKAHQRPIRKWWEKKKEKQES